MSLKIELKAEERFILGNAVITNGESRTKLYIEGDTPLLREVDIMRPEEADTPCKKIYLLVQLLYLAEDPTIHHDTYFAMVHDVQNAAPSTAGHFERINNSLLTGTPYKALKAAKLLISHEKELMEHAGRPSSLL